MFVKVGSGTNDLINYVLHLGRRSEYRIYRQRPGSMTRELVAAVPTKHPSYMHSFAVTEDYAVLATFPLVINPLSLLLSGKPFIENYRWRPELGTRLIVVNLNDGTVRGIATGDLCAFPDASIIDATYLDRLRHPDTPPASRWPGPPATASTPRRGAAELAGATASLPQVAALAGDVADAEHRRRLVELVDPNEGLDLLVNNASLLGPSPQPALANYPLAVLERVLRVNTLAPLALLQPPLGSNCRRTARPRPRRSAAAWPVTACGCWSPGRAHGARTVVSWRCTSPTRSMTAAGWSSHAGATGRPARSARASGSCSTAG